MVVSGGWAQSGSYPAAVDRKILGSLLTTPTGFSAPRPGVMPVADRFQFVSFANMTMTVLRGAAVLPGGYVVYNDAVASVTFDAVGSSARTDLIVARFYDAEAGDASTQATIEIVKGTGAAAPSVPARALLIATVAFPANASTTNSANASDGRVYTSVAGGVIVIPGALSASAGLLGLAPGTPVWDTQNGGRLGIVGGTDSGWFRVGRDAGFLPSAAQISSTNQMNLAASTWTQANDLTQDFQLGAGDVQVVGSTLRLVAVGLYQVTVVGEWGVGSSVIGNNYYAGFNIAGANSAAKWGNAPRANSFARTHPSVTDLYYNDTPNRLIAAFFATNDANAPAAAFRQLSATRVL